MPIPDLLLGTRRLRRNIEAQSVLLGEDIERMKFSTAQLRGVTFSRLTSPLGLLSAAAVGFVVGKVAAHPVASTRAKQISKHTLNHSLSLAIATARAIAMEVFLPMAIGWIQAKFTDKPAAEPTSSQSTSPPA